MQELVYPGSPVDVFPKLTRAQIREYKYHGSNCIYCVGANEAGDGGQGVLVLDASDSTSADNGFNIIVDALGRRWKRPESYISTGWLGVKSGDDIAPALNLISNWLKAKAIAAGTFVGLPRIKVPAGVYTLSDTVFLHYGSKIYSEGNVEFVAQGWNPSESKDMFRIANDSTILPVPDKGYINRDPWLNGENGSILITGPTYASGVTNNAVGVGVGNIVTNAAPIRGSVLHCVSIRHCGEAVQLRMRRLYLTAFTQCHFELNYRHLSIPTITGSEDSGERISFIECTFGGCRSQHVYCAKSPNIHFDHVSFDFVQGSGIYLEGIAEYGLFSFSNFHFENYNGNYFINAQTGARTKIFLTVGNVFNNSQIAPKTPETASSPSRPLVFLRDGGTVSITAMAMSYSYRPLLPDNFLVVAGSDEARARTRVTVNGLTAGDRTLTPCAFEGHVMNRSYKFQSESVGATITNASTYTTLHIRPLEGATWSSAITGQVQTLGSNKVLTLTSTSTGAFCALSTAAKIGVRPGKQYCTYFSLQKLAATGALNWALGFRWYDETGTLILEDTELSGSLNAVYSDSTLPGYSSDATTNGNRQLSSTFHPRYAPAGAVSCIPYLRLSNILGSVNVLGLVMWEVN